MLLSSLILFVVSPLISASVLPARSAEAHDHSHVEQRSLPGSWYQPRDHPVAALFKRGDDGVERPAVGSPEWAAPYPRGMPDINALPPLWVDALNAARAAGRIPNVPQSTANGENDPIYPPGVNALSIEVCSSTAKCRNPGDIWDAPEGVYASSFDDGPYPSSSELINFLSARNLHTTHFMIGLHILQNPVQFLEAFEAGNDIAVHTWSHKRMTTLSDLEIVGQLGWTLQIIHESTGGRVARYWRPPYGDSDNRVRAIAKEVFGLDTVIWNADSQDWRAAAGTPLTPVTDLITEFITGPKENGLVILEHEITPDYVRAFITTFPLIAQNGWRFVSLARAYGDDPYLNAESNDSDDVDVMPVGAPLGALPSTSSTPTTSTETSSTRTPTRTPAATGAAAPDASSGSQRNSATAVHQPQLCLSAVVSLLGFVVGSLLL